MPTFVVETYGCQMNVHDSERISGLLIEAGYTQALADSQPDLVVFNTYSSVASLHYNSLILKQHTHAFYYVKKTCVTHHLGWLWP